jgi:hypothetical protein
MTSIQSNKIPLFSKERPDLKRMYVDYKIHPSQDILVPRTEDYLRHDYEVF